jgi:Cu(I)/Ag(I) efflux system membrane fusion protein
MVPGGGGDWMQPGGDLQNPYWGSEMLTCGELVEEMGVGRGEKQVAAGDSLGGVK